MGKADGNISNAKIVFTQLDGMPLQKRGRIHSHIDKDIPDRPSCATDNLDLAMRRVLKVHPTDRAESPGPGMVHLHELGRQSVLSKRRLAKMPDKETSVVPSRLQIDHKSAVQRRWYDGHAVRIEHAAIR